jgi:hypothetical protein
MEGDGEFGRETRGTPRVESVSESESGSES